VATTSLPPGVVPKPERDAPLSDGGTGGGFGGGNLDEPNYGPHDPDSDPERWAVPLSAYPAGMWVAIVSIISLFLALTRAVELRWVNSKDWVSIALPHILYLNTVLLLVSSLTIELARLALRSGSRKRCALWLYATLFLGLAFVGGQLIAWQELVSRGVYLASHPGSFFFYLITATHGLHLLGGIVALACIIACANRLQRKRKQHTAVRVVALYWHFMDGLWLYVFALLFLTIQR
jgi:cytochrome c oxidase subunit III